MTTPPIQQPARQSLIALRRTLHAHPERSGDERRTHDTIRDAIRSLAPSAVITEHLGGCGLAATIECGDAARTVVYRADLDALPIKEHSGVPHASCTPGLMHACGHDGHSTIAVGLAARLSSRPHPNARVVILFQPAEETGQGAAAVLADPRWDDLIPDPAGTVGLAIHNMPGLPLGEVRTRAGVFACASVGVRVTMRGESAHASARPGPNAPTAALARALAVTPTLPNRLGLESARCTPVHASAGRPGEFGIAPPDAELAATLRATSDEDLARLRRAFEAMVLQAAPGLQVALTDHEAFPAMMNALGPLAAFRTAAQGQGLPYHEAAEPYPWSEDFAHFAKRFPCAMAAVGAGEQTPPLHDSRYDFPDELIAPAVGLAEAAVRALWA